ncbi:hypothetical protein C6I21_10850 [Alkalicoccus urumqiensis]|uniref:Uncharacterized protein n=2 Tax=Alkalicoccus urumqiensis TaxID=1548213 RepID=A0A2P6MGC8_ALKUR|nr:hypothetical protein C6I21_10850 [Alkalicoccus urumqiensis]
MLSFLWYAAGLVSWGCCIIFLYAGFRKKRFVLSAAAACAAGALPFTALLHFMNMPIGGNAFSYTYEQVTHLEAYATATVTLSAAVLLIGVLLLLLPARIRTV